MDRIIEIVNDCGGLSAIEDLQSHENINIYNRAVKVLETYFGGEEEEASEIVPDVVTGAGGNQQFGFGGAPGNNLGGGVGGGFSF